MANENLLKEVKKLNESLNLMREIGKAYAFVDGELKELKFSGFPNNEIVSLELNKNHYLYVFLEEYGKTWSFEKEDIPVMQELQHYNQHVKNKLWQMRSGPVLEISKMSTTHLNNALLTIDKALSNNLEDEIRLIYYKSIKPVILEELELRNTNVTDENDDSKDYDDEYHEDNDEEKQTPVLRVIMVNGWECPYID